MDDSGPVLCIDIGNTHTHVGRIRNGETEASFLVPTAGNDEASRPLVDFLAGQAGETGLVWCSVKPVGSNWLESLLDHVSWPGERFRLTADSCPLPIAYPKPQEIGQDRLAAAIAAVELRGVPVVVIDLGTAVTVDAVSQKGYEGGVIAPGLGIMTRYLHEQTALLPELDPEDLAVSAGIGKSTREAMKLGCAVGFSGMVRAVWERVQAELEQKEEKEVQTLVTGASSALLPIDWIDKLTYIPDLTLQGLAIAFHQRVRS